MAIASDTLIELGSEQESGLVETRVIDSRYEVLGLLGSGGMGNVYRVRDRELDEIVALKMIKPATHDTLAERILKEVRLSRKVTHRNVARVFELGQHEGKRFFTMELIEGRSLRDRLEAQRVLPIPEALDIASAVALGLEAAHEVGVIHRDLKPDNILLGPGGRVALTDFGIAASVVGSSTDTNSFLGTPLYMSPEQVDGQGPIDERSDLYALGVVLFEMLTGELPWKAESPLAVAAMRLTKPPPDPRTFDPALPEALAQFVRRCMARSAADRPRSASAVRLAIAELRAGDATVLLGQNDRSTARSLASRSVPEGAPSRPTTLADRGVARLALLPLSFQGPADRAYLAEGLGDDLTDSLSAIPSLRVVARRQVESVLEGHPNLDLRALGELLGISLLVEGRLRTLGSDRYRLSLRLISPDDGLQVWAHRTDFAEADVLTQNDAITQAIAVALTKPATLRARALDQPEAVELYFRARTHYRSYSPPDLEKANRLLEEALLLAPSDPTLLSLQALVLSRLTFFQGSHADQALVVAERAVAADPTSAEGHVAMAAANLQHGDFERAGHEAGIALRLSPLLPIALGVAGFIFAEIGPIERARRMIREAYEIDPLDQAICREYSRCLFLCGDEEQSDRLLEEAVTIGSTSSVVANGIARIRRALWKEREARIDKEVAAMEAQLSAEEWASPLGGFLRLFIGMLRREIPLADTVMTATIVQGLGLRRGLFFLQLLTEIALAHGEEEIGMRYLEQVVSQGLIDAVWLAHCPLLKVLRDRPVWTELEGAVTLRANTVREAFFRSRSGAP